MQKNALIAERPSLGQAALELFKIRPKGSGSVSGPEQLVYVTDLQLQATIRPGVSLPSFDTGARNRVLCGCKLSHLIAKEILAELGFEP
jgi:hypothetical protein